MRPMKSLVLAVLWLSLSAQSPMGWWPLFNGKDLTGWTQTGAAQWKVEDGVIVGWQAEPGKKICDITDDPTDPAEAKWREAGPITFQWPPAGEAGGFAGFVKYRNIRIREVHS